MKGAVFMRFIILALLIVPALEIGVFIWAGSIIGPWWVVGLILLTGLIGIAIATQQGMEAWFRARQAINMGQPPAGEIVDGSGILTGALLLLTRGYFTDIVGCILLLPLTRVATGRFLRRFFSKMMQNGFIIYRRW